MTDGDRDTTLVHGEMLSLIVHVIPCPRCRAGEGQPCRKRNGEPLSEGLPIRVHVHRITPVWVIYQIGVYQGRREMREKLRDQHPHQDPQL